MIYIDDKTELIRIQRHTSGEFDELGVVLENNLTHSLSSFIATNESISNYFYRFYIPDEIRKLDTGEYTYRIYDKKSDTEIDKGLLVIGNYIPTQTSYQYDKKTIQYNG